VIPSARDMWISPEVILATRIGSLVIVVTLEQVGFDSDRRPVVHLAHADCLGRIERTDPNKELPGATRERCLRASNEAAAKRRARGALGRSAGRAKWMGP
jgi:hypothetical protein